MCAVGSPTTERVTQYVGEQGKENRWPEDQPRGGAQAAQRPQPTWSSSKRGLEAVTGERLEIERLTSRSEEGRWKSTHRGNSLAAYPTSCPVRRGTGRKGSNDLARGLPYLVPRSRFRQRLTAGVRLPWQEAGRQEAYERK